MNPDPPNAGGGTTGYLSLGPTGRWWDDAHYVKRLHLRPPQQKQMDAIFDENRNSLISRYQELLHEQELLEAASHAATLNEAGLFGAIERVARARAELEKVNLHILLDLRKEMDAAQLAQLAKQP